MRACGAPLPSRSGTYREVDVVEEGKQAPEFELESDAGETVRKRLRASVRRTVEGSVVKLKVRY